MENLILLILLKKWNEWPFYNKKGLIIESLSTILDKRNVINYILKGLNINNNNDLLSIYYILTPQKIFHISKLENVNYNINDYVFDILQDKYNVIKPLSNELKVKNIYDKWKILHEKINVELKKLIDDIQNTNLTLIEKQNKLNEYNNNLYYKIKIDALYNNSKIINEYNIKFHECIETQDLYNNLNDLNKLFFTFIVDIDEIYYYFIDTLITAFRLTIKENKELKNLYKKEKNEILDLNWSYSLENSLLKSIFKKNIKYYIFNKKIIEYKNDIYYNGAIKHRLENILKFKDEKEQQLVKELINYMEQTNLAYEQEQSISNLLYNNNHIIIELNWTYFWELLLLVFKKMEFIDIKIEKKHKEDIKLIFINNNVLKNLIFLINITSYKLPNL